MSDNLMEQALAEREELQKPRVALVKPSPALIRDMRARSHVAPRIKKVVHKARAEARPGAEASSPRQWNHILAAVEDIKSRSEPRPLATWLHEWRMGKHSTYHGSDVIGIVEMILNAGL